MLIDSPYFPDELEALPALLAGAGFEPDALLATHADFDHLLGRLAFPELALGLGEPSVRAAAPASPARRSASCATRTTELLRGAARAAGARARSRRCRCPGSIELGDRGARAAPGRRPHRRRHGRVGALVRRAVRGRLPLERGDPDDPRAARSATTARRSPAWRRWSRRRRRSCPATARRTTATTALRILDEDVDYLDALERGEERPKLPEGRDTTRAAEDPRREPASVSP